MRLTLLCIFLILGSALAIYKLSYEEQFLRFKQKYGKKYSSVAQERRRFHVFKNNLMEIEEHNLYRESSYTKGINEWSDLTQTEWEDIYLNGYKRIGVGKGARHYNNRTSTLTEMKDLPSEVDWRKEGAITPVKNQGHCGSCWAFGTTEQVEAYTAIATGTLLELSTQQVTSCTPNSVNCGGTGGCQGSTPPLGYNYIQLFGQVAEADYPYVSGDNGASGDCEYDLANVKPMVSITGYDNLPPNDQEAIMNHIANVGPLAISVAANSFGSYHGGVFDGCDYNDNIQLNHAVQLVGYGTDSDSGLDYWLVRNSWGTGWGEDGYIRLLRESTPGCGMDTATSGHVCQGGPGYSEPLHVCGMCGMLFETSFPLGAHLL